CWPENHRLRLSLRRVADGCRYGSAHQCGQRLGSHPQRDCLVEAPAAGSEGNAIGLEALLAKRSGRGRSLDTRLSQTRAGGVTGGPCSVTQDPPRMISVLSSTNGCVGFLRNAGPRAFRRMTPMASPLAYSTTSTQRSKRLRPQIRQEIDMPEPKTLSP